MDKVVVAIVVLFLAFLAQYLWTLYRIPALERMLSMIPAPEELKEHSKEFKQEEVLQVTDGVYVAMNFALANTIMLVGSTGVVIVDTTESLTSARKIAAHFRNITNKRIEHIIYTHHHSDHILGSQAFINDSGRRPEIWAHSLFQKEESRIRLKNAAHFNRAQFQFGTYLQGKGFLNAGIGNRLQFDLHGKFRETPTQYIEQDMDVKMSGMNLRLIHIPGESSDQIGVWYPEKRVLLVADDLYKAFPNLYAIRGVTPRDVNDWVQSLDKMRRLQPRCVVGSHGKPVCGEEEVYNLLSDYMYGIQHIHDQTVRYINKGMHPEEIADLVKLPPELERHPYLMQYYGTVPWSVKGIYMMYMGWFSGDPVDLHPLPPSGRAQRMMRLVGKSGLLRAADEALRGDDYQWALELASYVHSVQPGNVQALHIRRDAMAQLAARQMSANARNFYMTAILNDAGELPTIDLKRAAKHAPMDYIMQAFRTRLKAESLPKGEQITGCFHFTDTNYTANMDIYKGVVFITDVLTKDCTFTLSTTEIVFREIIAGERSPVMSYISGAIVIDGGVLNLRRFMSYIEIQ